MKFLQAIAGVALGVAGVSAQQVEGVSRADLKAYNNDILQHADILARVIRSDNCKPKDKNNQVIKPTRDGAVQDFMKGLGKPKCIRNKNSKDNNDEKVTKAMSFGFKDGTVVDVMNNLGDGGIKIQCFRKDDSFCPDKPNNNDPKDQRADQLRKLFKSQDKDGSGKIPPGAAYALLKQYLDGNKDTKDFADSKYIEQILQKMTSQPGEVGLSEIFCISKYLTKVGEAYNLFNAEDKSGDGTLSNKEAEESLVEFYTKYSGVQVPDDCKSPQCTMHRQQIMQQAQKAAASFFNKVDGNQDKKISFDEYEKDAFKEIHFRAQDCQAAAKPTLEKENDLIKQIYYKFAVSDGDKSSMSSEDFYQFSAQLESKVSLKMLGCDNQKIHSTPVHIFDRKPQYTPASTAHRLLQVRVPGVKGSGSGGRPNFGGNTQTGGRPGVKGSGSGGRPNFGGNTQTGGRPNFGGNGNTQIGGTGGRPNFGNPRTPAYVKDLADGVSDMLEDAYDNSDKLGYSDFLKGMQNMKDDLNEHNDFDKMLQYASTLKPVDCKQFTECHQCTKRENAGLCGWTKASKFDFQNKNQGRCSFVDKDEEADNSDASADIGTETCMFQCPSMRPVQKPTSGYQQKPGNFRGGSK